MCVQLTKGERSVTSWNSGYPVIVKFLTGLVGFTTMRVDCTYMSQSGFHLGGCGGGI